MPPSSLQVRTKPHSTGPNKRTRVVHPCIHWIRIHDHQTPGSEDRAPSTHHRPMKLQPSAGLQRIPRSVKRFTNTSQKPDCIQCTAGHFRRDHFTQHVATEHDAPRHHCGSQRWLQPIAHDFSTTTQVWLGRLGLQQTSVTAEPVPLSIILLHCSRCCSAQPSQCT